MISILQEGFETNFGNLITTGKTITQEQADKIKVVINKVETAKKVNLEKTKTMTDKLI